MGKVASSVDTALIKSFWSYMQSELLDRQPWTSRVKLASAMFEWIEGWYNFRRRYSSLGMISPTRFEQPDKSVPRNLLKSLVFIGDLSPKINPTETFFELR
jgi:hypothetical protein